MSGSSGNQTKPAFSPAEGLLLILGFLVVAGTFGLIIYLAKGLEDTIALPTLSILGIVLLLMCLAAIAYVFTRSGLQDPSQALGLPAGSIQSVIALSLIVLFAILSVFIFTSLGDVPHKEFASLTAADRDKLVVQMGTNFDGWAPGAIVDKVQTYNVYSKEPAPDARIDVGKQLIVLIGTLMTSAVSFYFGSRATAAGVAAAAGVGNQAAADTPLITAIGAPEAGLPKGQATTVTINGQGLAGIDGVSLTQAGATPLAVTDVKATATSVRFTVTPDANAPSGAYDLQLTTAGQTVVTRTAALSVL